MPDLVFCDDCQSVTLQNLPSVSACVRRTTLAVSGRKAGLLLGSNSPEAASKPRNSSVADRGMCTTPERQNKEASSYFGSAGKMYLHNRSDPRETTIILIRDFHLVSHQVKSRSKH
jgi:hypothetical protein